MESIKEHEAKHGAGEFHFPRSIHIERNAHRWDSTYNALIAQQGPRESAGYFFRRNPYHNPETYRDSCWEFAPAKSAGYDILTASRAVNLAGRKTVYEAAVLFVAILGERQFWFDGVGQNLENISYEGVSWTESE